jgi:hypothetical protein
MKLLATLDFWDGRPGKTKECDLEDVTGSAVIGSLMSKGVASVTFTRPPDLLKITTEES